jgi:hypothetical protein
MAKIIGQNGAYKGVLESLRTVDLSVECLEELTNLQFSLTQKFAMVHEIGLAEYILETNRLESELLALEEEMQAVFAEKEAHIRLEIDRLSENLQVCRDRSKELGGFFSIITSFGRLRSWWNFLREIQIFTK